MLNSTENNFFELVKKLRDTTGIGILKCKAALEHANNDLESAIEYLHKTGVKMALKKGDRLSQEGIVKAFIHGDLLILYELNAETDFAINNQKFIDLQINVEKVLQTLPAGTDISVALNTVMPGSSNKSLKDLITDSVALIGENINLSFVNIIDKKPNTSFGIYNHMDHKLSTACIFSGVISQNDSESILMHIAALNPRFISRNDIDTDFIEQERQIIKDLVAKDKNTKSKPCNIIDRIIDGRLNKYLSELCLLDQSLVTDNTISVAKYLKEHNISIIKMYRIYIKT